MKDGKASLGNLKWSKVVNMMPDMAAALMEGVPRERVGNVVHFRAQDARQLDGAFGDDWDLVEHPLPPLEEGVPLPAVPPVPTYTKVTRASSIQVQYHILTRELKVRFGFTRWQGKPGAVGSRPYDDWNDVSTLGARTAKSGGTASALGSADSVRRRSPRLGASWTGNLTISVVMPDGAHAGLLDRDGQLDALFVDVAPTITVAAVRAYLLILRRPPAGFLDASVSVPLWHQHVEFQGVRRSMEHVTAVRDAFPGGAALLVRAGQVAEGGGSAVIGEEEEEEGVEGEGEGVGDIGGYEDEWDGMM